MSRDYGIYYIFVPYVDIYITFFIFTTYVTSTRVYTLPYTTTAHLQIP